MTNSIEASYVYLRANNEEVARTVPINANVNVDLDHNGQVIGIETIGGTLDMDVLYQVLRSVRIAI